MRKLILLLVLTALLCGCGATVRTGEPYDTLTAFGQATGVGVGISGYGHHKVTLHFPDNTSQEQVLQRLQEITAVIEAAKEVPDADE